MILLDIDRGQVWYCIISRSWSSPYGLFWEEFCAPPKTLHTMELFLTVKKSFLQCRTWVWHRYSYLGDLSMLLLLVPPMVEPMDLPLALCWNGKGWIVSLSYTFWVEYPTGEDLHMQSLDKTDIRIPEQFTENTYNLWLMRTV